VEVCSPSKCTAVKKVSDEEKAENGITLSFGGSVVTVALAVAALPTDHW
jgi:hypothetical protein